MKKKLLSLVCALALTISLLPAAQALEGEGTRAAEALASLGLVTGTGAGYAAEKPATQEQAAALLVRLLGAEKTAKADRRSCGWAGIPSWARSAVNYCAFHDLIDWSEYRAGRRAGRRTLVRHAAARARLRLRAGKQRGAGPRCASALPPVRSRARSRAAISLKRARRAVLSREERRHAARRSAREGTLHRRGRRRARSASRDADRPRGRRPPPLRHSLP